MIVVGASNSEVMIPPTMSPTKVELALFAMIRVVFYVPRSYRLKHELVLYPKTEYKFHDSILTRELFNRKYIKTVTTVLRHYIRTI